MNRRTWVRVSGGALLAAWGVPGLVRAGAQPGAAAPAGRSDGGAPWQSLFDGRSLAGWAPSGFEGEGAVTVQPAFRDGQPAIVVERGTVLSGFTWTKGSAFPRQNYEIALEAMRLAGDDFFCGLTFPVGAAACTLIVGGWGGVVVGLSSVDRLDASQNETGREMPLSDHRWYRIRVRVEPSRIQTWLDDERVVDLDTRGRTLGLRPGEIQKSLPLGIATYMTRAAVRGIRWRPI